MTKIFLLLSIALLVIPSSVLLSRCSGLQAKPVGKSLTRSAREAMPASGEAAVADELHIQYTHIDFGAKSGEDDGSTHTFHFDRISRNRRRAILCISAKCILIFTHLCWIIKDLLHIHLAI